jgi:hypothetical protein
MRQTITTAADLLGGLLIAIGAGLIYAPAAFIVAGLLIIAASIRQAS